MPLPLSVTPRARGLAAGGGGYTYGPFPSSHLEGRLATRWEVPGNVAALTAVGNCDASGAASNVVKLKLLEQDS